MQTANPALAMHAPALPQASHSGASIRPAIEVITDRGAFERLEGEWKALECAADGAVFFQSHAWCRAIWDHWIAVGRRFEPRILVARARGRMVGVLPLRMTGHYPLRIATGLGEPFQQYTEAVLHGDGAPETADLLLAEALRLRGCDGLELRKVRDESFLQQALAKRGATRANADSAPFVDLRPFETFEDYHATVNAKTRKNMRNSRNRLSRAGRLEHRILSEAREIGELARRAHAGRERWLLELGLTSRAFREPSFIDLANRLTEGDTGVTTLAMSLELDGRPIADQWGFVFGDRYYAFVATWDPAFEESSPGKLQMEDVIRVCHARGLAVADFLMPAVRYKLTWTDRSMGAADYALSSSWRGSLHRRLWTGALRPALKRAVLALPSRARSRLTSMVLERRPKPLEGGAPAIRA